ncbi:glutamate formimidoyltransferase [Acidobacteria bacterium AH-259-D05]|nr:glutamate formimidoyltransferase [Acidobacteria bacterium AH-259-D05]
MQQIVESVINISEGRDANKLEAIATEIEAIANSFLLSYSADRDHHRSVFSFIGTPCSIFDAAFAATKKAVQLIDLRRHRGVHPRIGAVDVIPFVPIQGVSMDQCVEIARRLGEKIGLELEIPVYLYAEAARSPDFQNLAVVRKGQFEELKKQIKTDPQKKPDFGPTRIHPTAGGIVVGARQPLIAFNVYLNSSDVGVARRIAARIRESEGGLPGVKALGFYIEHQGLVQVSMNVTDYRQTSLLEIFLRVREEAQQLQTEVVCSEIVGLIPQDALDEETIQTLRFEDFDQSQILETRIAEVLEKQSKRAIEQ